LILSGCTCAGRLPGRKATRPPEQAGRYYPADPAELRAAVDELLLAVAPVDGPVQAILVPHAGLDWSGRVAAAAFGALKKKSWRRIVLVGESHRGLFPGVALPAEGALATPLGKSRVDEASVAMLEGYPGFARRAAAFDNEHTIEVLLPYVQRLWPDTPIVPVVLGDTNPGDLPRVGAVLRNLLDEGTLLVITVTLTHFGYDPEQEPFSLGGTKPQLQARVIEFEKPLVQALLSRDPKAVAAARAAHPSDNCGLDAVTAALYAMGPVGKPGQEVARGSSLDYYFPEDAPRGVSYLGAVYPGRFPAVAALDASDRLTLSRIAEEGVAASVAGRDAPPLGEVSPRLLLRGGAFVTVTRHGQLKGCMGRLDAESTAVAVAAAARMAVRSDPRFNPLRPEDLAQVELEISVLGPFEVIDSPDEFEPGRHGLLLTRGLNRGLLLPQVATKYELDRDQFLEALAEKAGLPSDLWRGAKLERFGVEAFEVRPAAH